MTWGSADSKNKKDRWGETFKEEGEIDAMKSKRRLVRHNMSYEKNGIETTKDKKRDSQLNSNIVWVCADA